MTSRTAAAAFTFPAFLGGVAAMHLPCCALPVLFALFGAQFLPFHSPAFEWALAVMLPVAGKAVIDRVHARAHRARPRDCGHVCADHRQPVLKTFVSYAAWVALSVGLMLVHNHFLHA